MKLYKIHFNDWGSNYVIAKNSIEASKKVINHYNFMNDVDEKEIDENGNYAYIKKVEYIGVVAEKKKLEDMELEDEQLCNTLIHL